MQGTVGGREWPERYDREPRAIDYPMLVRPLLGSSDRRGWGPDAEGPVRGLLLSQGD
jgi:hypothetical protein